LSVNGTRHYRDVKVADEFWTLNRESSPRRTVGAKGVL
jgi:hypothetical protein